MKTYKVKVPKANKNTIRAIEMVIVDGGFVTDRAEWDGNGKHDVEFTIEANDDREFADLFIEVGQTLAKNFPL